MKKSTLVLALLAAFGSPAWTRYVDTKAITTATNTVLTTGAGAGDELPLGNTTFQAKLTGSGSPYGMTVVVQVSNNNADWEDAITFVLISTGTVKDYGTIVNSWRYARYVSSGLQGTPTVTMTMSGG
jgi:hypothetical protein